MPTKSLADLFLEQLKDIYYAERKILSALPKMVRGAQSEELKAAFRTHREQTEDHVARLQEVFKLLDKPVRGKTCPAIDGILDEGEEVLDAYKGMPVVDAGLIAAAQAVEHYEIARYGTLARWAELLGYTDAAQLLNQTLQEEEETDALLTSIADESVNQAAMEAA